MQIRLEMGPKEFVLATRVPIFLVGETLDIVLAGGETLSGRVVATKDAVYGGGQTPLHPDQDRGDLHRYREVQDPVPARRHG